VPTPDWFSARHFTVKIPPTEEKAEPPRDVQFVARRLEEGWELHFGIKTVK
jgi:hypothetical protein